MHYLIGIKDYDDKLIQTTVCNEKELINLLQHMDKDKYIVEDIMKLCDKVTDYKEFCKKDKNLETGKL